MQTIKGQPTGCAATNRAQRECSICCIVPEHGSNMALRVDSVLGSNTLGRTLSSKRYASLHYMRCAVLCARGRVWLLGRYPASFLRALCADCVLGIIDSEYPGGLEAFATCF